MKLVIAILSYLIITISILQNWLLLAGVLVVFFSLRFGGVALIPLAVIIDGYFGNFYGWPYLSVLAIVWYVVFDYLRPKILNPNLVKNSVWQN